MTTSDNGYRRSGFEVPQRRRAADPETGERRRLSRNQKAVNSAHARQLKSWKIPPQGPLLARLEPPTLVKAVLVLINAS